MVLEIESTTMESCTHFIESSLYFAESLLHCAAAAVRDAGDRPA